MMSSRATKAISNTRLNDKSTQHNSFTASILFESFVGVRIELELTLVRMVDIKTVIVLLNRKNYQTWKVQCRMALVKDSLWGLV